MWPFDRTKTARGVDRGTAGGGGGTNTSQPASDSPALVDAIARLNKRVDSIEMEWNEWFDKFRRLYARIAKRQEREEATQPPDSPQSRQDAPEPTNGLQPVSGGPHPRRNY